MLAKGRGNRTISQKSKLISRRIVGDFMLRDNIVTRMFKLGLDFMRQ